MSKTIGIVMALTDNVSKKVEMIAKKFKKTEESLEEASKRVIRFNAKCKKLAADGLKKIQSNSTALNSHLRAMAAPLAICGVSIGAIGRNALQTAAKFEKYRVSFDTLLQSQTRSKKLMDEITQYAAKTPFAMEDLVEGSQRLLAFGIGANDVVDKLGRLGDLSMGDSEKLGRLTLAFGKIKAKGKASMEELNQLTEAGVPILQELAKQQHVSTSAMMKMVSKGTIGYAQVEKAIVSLTSKGGQFYGMTAKQGQTLEGLFSTLNDSWNIATAELAEKFMPQIKQICNLLMDNVPKIITAVTPVINNLVNVLTVVLNNLDVIIPVVWTALKAFLAFHGIAAIGNIIMIVVGAFQVLGGVFGLVGASLGAFLGPVGLVIVAITALTAGIIWCVKNWEKICKVISTAIKLVGAFVGIAPKEIKADVKTTSTSAKINGSHANGLANVPFNGYVAELHKGERVLTASENRNYNTMTNTQSTNKTVTINFYGDIIGNGEFLNKIKFELGQELKKALAT